MMHPAWEAPMGADSWRGHPGLGSALHRVYADFLGLGLKDVKPGDILLYLPKAGGRGDA